MLGENLDITNGQYLPSLLLKKGDSEDQLEKGGMVPPRSPYGFRHGATEEDTSGEEDIQRQKSLESIADTFQPRSNTGVRQLYFLDPPPIVTIDSEVLHVSVNPNLPRAIVLRWEGNEAFRSYFWMTEPPTTDAEQRHADVRAMLDRHIRGILEHSAAISHWDVSEAFQPRSLGAASSSVTVDLEHTDERAVLNEILAELDAVVRWREEWEEDEEEHAPEKPSDSAIDRAKQVVCELIGCGHFRR